MKKEPKKRPKKLPPPIRLSAALTSTTGGMSIVFSPRGDHNGLIIVVKKRWKYYTVIFRDGGVRSVEGMRQLWGLLDEETTVSRKSVVRVRRSTPKEIEAKETTSAPKPAPTKTTPKPPPAESAASCELHPSEPDASSETTVSLDDLPEEEGSQPATAVATPNPTPGPAEGGFGSRPDDVIVTRADPEPEPATPATDMATPTCEGKKLVAGDVFTVEDDVLILVIDDEGSLAYQHVDESHMPIPGSKPFNLAALLQLSGMTDSEFAEHEFVLHAIPSSPEPAAEAAAPVEPAKGGQQSDQPKPQPETEMVPGPGSGPGV